jgi:hypothetical protein
MALTSSSRAACGPGSPEGDAVHTGHRPEDWHRGRQEGSRPVAAQVMTVPALFVAALSHLVSHFKAQCWHLQAAP